MGKAGCLRCTYLLAISWVCLASSGAKISSHLPDVLQITAEVPGISTAELHDGRALDKVMAQLDR
jgi:hypothetical protein